VYPQRLVYIDPTEGSETSANINQTLGIHQKVETVNTEHSESLKSRITNYEFPGLIPGSTMEIFSLIGDNPYCDNGLGS
jgi:hypothetical protein